MDPKTPSATDRIYEDFDPIFEWARDETSATLRIMLPGFTREHLKIQVTSDQISVSGERRVLGNRWRRFNKQLSVPFGVDTNKVNANVEGGLLYVKFPQGVPTPHEKTTKTPSEESPPQKEKERIGAPVETPKTMARAPTQQQETRPVSEETPQKEKEPAKPPSESAEAKTEPQETMKPPEATVLQKQQPVPDEEQPKAVQEVSPKPKGDKEEEETPQQGRLKKAKKFMNLIVLVLLVVVLGLYAKNAFRSLSSPGRQKFQES